MSLSLRYLIPLCTRRVTIADCLDIYTRPLQLSAQNFDSRSFLQVLLDNGLVKLTILKPQGILAGIKYGGMENLLDLKSGETGRGYFSIYIETS